MTCSLTRVFALQIDLELPKSGPSLGDIRVDEIVSEGIHSNMDLRSEDEFVKPVMAENSCTVDESKVPDVQSEPIRASEGVL